MPRAELVDVAVDRDTGRRTLVAKRRFEAGEILATDSPLIVWAQNESGLLKAFQASEDQETILSLYSPALDRQDEKIDERRRKAISLARTKAFSGLEKDVVLRVLLIGDAFAHQFGTQEALYATASALKHDCAPNCRFRSQPDGSGHGCRGGCRRRWCGCRCRRDRRRSGGSWHRRRGWCIFLPRAR